MNHKRNPVKMIHSEMEQLRTIRGDKNALKQYWEKRYTDTYRELFSDRSELGRYGVIAEYILRIVRRGSILDVGCGPGILAELIQSSSLSYTGIDIAGEAISMARKNHPQIKENFICTPLDAFHSNTRFEAIVANEILYYIDPDIFFRDCKRLLAPNGHLVVSLYDFDEGRKLIPVATGYLTDPFRVEVFNQDKSLRWQIIAGKFNINP